MGDGGWQQGGSTCFHSLEVLSMAAGHDSENTQIGSKSAECVVPRTSRLLPLLLMKPSSQASGAKSIISSQRDWTARRETPRTNFWGSPSQYSVLCSVVLTWRQQVNKPTGHQSFQISLARTPLLFINSKTRNTRHFRYGSSMKETQRSQKEN